MVRAVCKLLFLLCLALFLPRFLLIYAPQYQILSGKFGIDGGDMRLGITSFLDYIKSSNFDLKDKKILLVTNQMYDNHTNGYLQFLSQNGVAPNVVCRSSENHVFTKLDDISLDDYRNILPVKVLDTFSKSDIKKSDVVLLDLQNSGFVQDDAISSLLNIMYICQVCDKPLIILDRPNPLGALIEGPLVNVSTNKQKFMLPLRYGMSLGELASYANQELLDDKLVLTVLPLRNYLRNSYADFEKLQKVYTSGLFRMLNGICPADIKSDCRGKFQCFALPEYLNFPVNKWYELRAVLRRYNIDVSLCRYLSRKTNQYFVGVRLNIHDINKVSYLKVWQLILQCMHDSHINLRQTAFLKDLFGTKRAKQFIAGKLDQLAVDGLNKDLKKFYTEAKSHFIYRPWPKKVLL